MGLSGARVAAGVVFTNPMTTVKISIAGISSASHISERGMGIVTVH